MELNDSIKTIKGIGDKTASAFARLGIETVNDLLLNYPRTYVTYEDPVDISDLQAGSRQSVRAVVNSRAEVRKVHGLTIVILYAKDFSGTIKLTWFNCPFLRNFFHIGQEFVFVGNVAYKGGMMTMTQPEYYTDDKYGELTHVWQLPSDECWCTQHRTAGLCVMYTSRSYPAHQEIRNRDRG